MEEEPKKRAEEPSLPVAGSIPEPKKFEWDPAIDPEFDVFNHVPEQGVKPLHPKTFQALNAKQVKNMINRNQLPHLYANPMQHTDYKVYEALLKHTFIGALADAFIKYLIGTGFKPELEVINPDKEDKKNQELIEKNQQVITDLKEIDRRLESNDEGHLDTSWKQKISALVMSTLMYNRGALLWQYEKPVEINGKTYSKIPTNAVFAHAQDLGIIETDPDSRRMKGVQYRYGSGMVSTEHMIYLWNPLTSSKVHNSWHYGTSILSPMISASKLIRQILSDDFPAMARTTWAGLYLLVAKPDGNTKESKQAEWNALTQSLKPGKPGVLIKDPEEVNSFDIKFEPKIQEFQGLFESMIKLCISIMGLPQVGFYDEAAANRATMVGKIQLTMRTTIEPFREWIGEAICKQHYQRWFEIMYADDKKLLEQVKIKMSFDDLHISEWYDSIEAILQLDGRKQLKDAEFGELIGLDNYLNIVDSDAETQPGGQGGKKNGHDGRRWKTRINEAR